MLSLQNKVSTNSGGAEDLINPIDFTGITHFMHTGDSIASGQGATAGNSYRELLDTNYSTTNNNLSVGGRGVFREVFNFNAATFTRNISAVWIEGGLNDLRRSAIPQTTNKLESSLKTILARAYGSSTFAASGSTNVTRVGSFITFDAKTYGGVFPSGTLGTGNFACFSNTVGNTWTWSFTGDNVHVIFNSGSPTVTRGNCEVRIDGDLVETITDASNRWDGVSDGDNDNKRGPDTRYYWDIGTGSHTIEVKVTSAAAVVVDKFGVLDTPSNVGVVCVIEIPYVQDYNKVGLDQANGTKIDTANLVREAVVNTLKSRGYKIRLCRINLGKGGSYDRNNTADGVHPNDAGYLQIYNSEIRYIG